MSNTNSRSIGTAIALILIGGAFLLNNLNILPYFINDYFFNWKGILLVVGIVSFTTRENRGAGIALIAVSSFFIVSEITEDLWGLQIFKMRIIWPIFLIIGGVLLLARRGNLGNLLGKESSSDDYHSDEPEEPSDRLNATAILGGGDMTIQTPNFRGGKFTAFMGGGSYDLSNSELADGTQVIDMFAMFGGGTFIVPSGWRVRLEVTSIFGGFSDSRKRNAMAPPSDPDKVLVIKGLVIFGGGEIKNFV